MHRIKTVPATAAGLAAGWLAALALVSTASAAPAGFRLEPSIPWRSAGNGTSDNHYAPDEYLLGPSTLGFLKQRWVFTTKGDVPDTPTVEGDNVYASDFGGSVWRIDAQTGREIWEASLPTITGNMKSMARVSPAIAAHTVIVGDQASATVFALSKTDGRPVWRTRLATQTGAIITASPLVVGDRIYVGVASSQESLAASTPGFVPDFRGSIVALDTADGHIVWQTYTVPEGFTGGSVWGSNVAYDRKRHAVLFSTGNNYSVPASVQACQTAAGDDAVKLDACLPANDHMDSIVSVNSDTGSINWGQRFQNADTWTVSCIQSKQPAATPCPSPSGPDADFGSAPNLFTIDYQGGRRDVVGAGQKKGVYWTLDRDTGKTLWATQVGPGGTRGGIEWGTATDGNRVYVPEANSDFTETTLIPSGQKTNGGFWSALDASTGKILWQTPTFALQPQMVGSPRTPQPPPGVLAKAEGSVTIANGVLYGEDAAGYFVALDAASGRILKTRQSGGSAIGGPAIVDGVLYWGSGYADIGTGNNKLYAFWLGIQ